MLRYFLLVGPFKTLHFLFGCSEEQTDKRLSRGLMCPAGEQEQEQRTSNLMAKNEKSVMEPHAEGF